MSEPNTSVVPTCEAIIKSIVTAAKTGHVIGHETTDAHETWTIQVGDDTYMVENISRKSKTGRDFNKTNLKQLNGDTWKTVNLGDWKKKLFYTLLYCLQENKLFTKIKKDPALVSSVAQAIKNNRGEWDITMDHIKGQMNGKSIEVIRDRVTYESGKTLYRVKMLEDGTEVLKGSQLMKLWK